MKSNGSFGKCAINPIASSDSVHPRSAHWPASSLIRWFISTNRTASGSSPSCTPNGDQATGENGSVKSAGEHGKRAHSAFSIQFANPHVAKAHRVAMILQIERSLLGKTVERSRRRALLSDRNMVLNQDPIMQHGK